MTLSLKITHNSPSYGMRALITPTSPTGLMIDADARIVADGETVELLVHSGRHLHVQEIGPAEGAMVRSMDNVEDAVIGKNLPAYGLDENDIDQTDMKRNDARPMDDDQVAQNVVDAPENGGVRAIEEAAEAAAQDDSAPAD